jgi:hypothetical protein
LLLIVGSKKLRQVKDKYCSRSPGDFRLSE